MDVDDGRCLQSKMPKGKTVNVTYDSGLGATCMPERLMKSILMNPKAKKVAAANGSERRQ